MNYTLAGQRGTIVRDDETYGFTVWDDYLLVDRPEGTILEERFNSVTEITENPQNIISAKNPVVDCMGKPHFYSYCVKMGDVNGDGSVTADDSLLVQQAVVELVTLTEEQFTAADVNEDGTVDAMDAKKILDYIVEYIHSFW